MRTDSYKNRSKGITCSTCMCFDVKESEIQNLGVKYSSGHCHKHSPSLNGYPNVIGGIDWCGDHKLDENKL